jgi:hypothetical protein
MVLEDIYYGTRFILSSRPRPSMNRSILTSPAVVFPLLRFVLPRSKPCVLPWNCPFLLRIVLD